MNNSTPSAKMLRSRKFRWKLCERFIHLFACNIVSQSLARMFHHMLCAFITSIFQCQTVWRVLNVRIIEVVCVCSLFIVSHRFRSFSCATKIINLSDDNFWRLNLIQQRKIATVNRLSIAKKEMPNLSRVFLFTLNLNYQIENKTHRKT